MEDGAVGGFVQRGVATAGDERAVVEMGGGGTTDRRHARHRSLGARLLEVLPRPHGHLSG